MRTEAGVLVSLSSYGAAEVRRHGQLWFSQLALDACADGVEVRSELLVDAAQELPAIGKAVRASGGRLVYSEAQPLWDADGALDVLALQRAMQAAQALGAPRLKMAIGGFGITSHGSFSELQQCLQQGEVELLIENDQTASAGTLDALQAFYAAAAAHGVAPGMTFDLGNWHWNGECALQAADALAAQVRYVHCKGVQRQAQRWVAVPLTESAAPWRAVLRALPRQLPWAIEYPLQGDDLLAVTRREIETLRSVAASLLRSDAALS